MKLALSAVLLALAAPSALGCAVVGRSDDSVRIESERAIIVWDATRKVQHFIREARFDGKAKADFGFLVPTPTKPELAEVDPEAFSYVFLLTIPDAVRVAAKAAPAAAEQKAEVKVLERKKVGGLDAAVLETSDPEALDRWLKKNGYVSGPALVEWYRPYVAEGWKITAFKLDMESARSAPVPVRMSFHTDRPFFPYREPPSEGKDRVLRVYFVADGRYDATLSADARWPGRAMWSNALRPKAREDLWKLINLPAGEAKGVTWLTEFEDRASPRPAGGELFFARAADQSSIARFPQQEGSGAMPWVWAMVLVVAAAILVFAIRRSRRRADG